MLFIENDFSFAKDFHFNNKHYYLCVRLSGEVILGYVYWVMDPFNWDDDYKEINIDRVESKNKYSGIIIYKKAIKLLNEYVYTYYPKTFYYTTHGDKSLSKFFTFLSKKLETKRYMCTCRDGKHFIFERLY